MEPELIVVPPGTRAPALASSSSRDEQVTAPKRKLIDGDEVIDSPTRTKARRVVEESSDSEDGAVAARAQAAAMAFAAGPAWEEQAGPAAAPLPRVRLGCAAPRMRAIRACRRR